MGSLNLLFRYKRKWERETKSKGRTRLMDTIIARAKQLHIWDGIPTKDLGREGGFDVALT
jgi:hypothetical protein